MTLSSDSIPSPTGFEPAQKSPEAPVTLARATILCERVWSRLWPASGIAGLLLAAALAGLFAPLPWLGHAFLIALAVTAMGLMLDHTFRDFRLPRWSDGARRIERDSALTDRPITEGNDTLAAGRGDAWAEALWRETLRRRLASAQRLRLSWPHPKLAERDPRALRYGVLLLVIGAGVLANTSWRERLAQAFLASDNTNGIVAGLDAWIDPPAYTGQAPVYLSAATTGTIAVPEGSRLNIRVHGAEYAPLLNLSPSPQSGGTVQGQNGEYAANAVLVRDSSVRIRASGRTLGNWTLQVIPDKPPTIAFTGKPGPTERSALKIPFRAGDDYGVTSVRALIKPVGRRGAILSAEIALGSQSAKSIAETAYQDFTTHPYAGLMVALTLEARDGAGHVARSKTVTVQLPARIFTNPLARALIEQRQDLASDGHARPKVELALDALTLAPELFYADKRNIYTALRSALHALQDARTAADVQRVEDLLWQTAIALEQGSLQNAAQELRHLQQLLTEALASGAPQEVIDALLQRYMNAMQRYMQLLAQNPGAAPPGPPPPDAKTLSMEDLQALLKVIQEMSQSGNREGAAEALAMLQGLLENMRMSQGGSGSGGGESPEDKARGEALKKLGDLMGQQRQLLDKTYRQGQGTGDPKDNGNKGLSDQQGAIHNKLDDAGKGLGSDDKKKLDEAGHDMGSAQNQLGGNDTDSALESEKNALEAMRSGADNLEKQLLKDGDGDDPLGRAAGQRAPSLGKGVKVPAESEMQRARNILEELRRRAAERGRPQEELDYIDRLLKQF